MTQVWLTAVAKRFTQRLPLVYGAIRRELADVDTYSRDERLAMQSRLLSRSLQDSAAASLYRGNDPSYFEHWPVLEKQTLLTESPSSASTSWLPSASAQTSGTTGKPLQVKRSLASIIREQATIDHAVAKADVQPTGPMAVFRGEQIKSAEDEAPPFWSTKGETTVFSVRHLNKRNITLFIQALEDRAPHILFAYPSALEQLIRLGEKKLQAIRSLRLVMTSSEALPEGLRGDVQDLWKVPLLDYYGQAERVSFAWSLRDKEYWMRPEYGYTETLNERNGIADLVCSNLRNSAQRLVRYRTGDQVEALAEWSLVNLGIRPFNGIFGRSAEYIELPDGARIIGLNHIPRGIDGLSSLQILQIAPDAVELHVVPTAGLDEALRSQIAQRFRSKVPNSIAFQVIERDGPILTEAGKAPLYIRQF